MKTNRWAGSLFALAVIFSAACWAGDAPGMALAVMPMFGVPLIKRDEEGGGGGGGGMSNKAFQDTVVGKLTEVKETQGDMLKKYDQLDKTTKDAFEELTKVKNAFTGLDADVKAFDAALKKVHLNMVLEQRMANGGNTLSLGQRTIRDKEKAKHVFANICRAIGMPDLAAKALGEDSSPGSTLINDDLSTEVYDSLMRYGAWATLGVRPVGTKNTKVPIKTARPEANFILTEGGTISDDTSKAGTTITLEVEVIAVLLNVSLQLIEDGEIDIVADVLDDFIEAVNYRADFAAFAGNGTANAANGGCTGLFNFATAAPAAATRTSIAKTKYEDWLKCLTSVDAAVLGRAARWWMHPTLMAAAIGVQDANGRPIFQTATEAPSAGGILNLFGYPVTPVGAAPSADAASAKIAVFGDPRAMAVGLRKAFTFESSDHHRWNTLERSFRGHCRFDAVGAKASALTVLTLPAA